MTHTALNNSKRSGMTILVVLCLVAITLGTSYMLMRSQFTGVRIQQNTNRKSLARQAAMVGLSVAMRKMGETGWAGVGTSISGNITDQESYQATYTAGDDSVLSNPTLVGEYPYRVTILSTGTSTDSSTAGLRAIHRVKAVVKLIPRSFATGPPELAGIATHTLYQTGTDTFKLQVPLRIEGAARLQGQLDYMNTSNTYTWQVSQRDKYIGDLRLMWLAGVGDYRPFEGPLELPFSVNDATTQSWLTSTAGVSLTNVPAGTSAQWVHPGSISSYRIYPGGPAYSVTSVGSNVNSTYAPDPLTNPLSILYRSGDAQISNGSSVTGTLIVSGVVTVSGLGVSLQPAPLPAINGMSATPRLPTLVAGSSINFNSPSTGTFDGLVVTFNELYFQRRGQNTAFTMKGNTVAKKFRLEEGKNEFFQTLITSWNQRLLLFTAQLTQTPHIDYFPQYMSQLSIPQLQYDPKVKFLRPTTPPVYGWLAEGAEVFGPLPADGGLRWQLVSWRDNQ